MKKSILVLMLFVSLALPVQNAKAAMDAKSKAFMVVTAYGTVSGALLGFASMAFGSNSKAIAQGASLGLYAGIIFGAYIVSSHNSGPIEDDPNAMPYGDDQYPDDGTGGGFPQEEEGGGSFFGAPKRVLEINQKFVNNFKPVNEKRENKNIPPTSLNNA